MEIKKISQSIVGEFKRVQDAQSEKPKKESNTLSKYADAYGRVLKKMEEIDQLQSKIDQLESKIDQSESKVDQEKKSAVVNLVSSAVAAGATFGMGAAAGAGAAAGNAAGAAEDAATSSDDSTKTKSESEVELFKMRVRKLLA